eukprot:13474660-Alexandrium_andersonii.AAC.1
MSASLVGSEMCIRDRRYSDAPRRKVGCSCGTRPLCARQPRGSPWHFHTPVSYTHLTLPTICSV